MINKKLKERELGVIAKNLSQVYRDSIQITEGLKFISELVNSSSYKKSLVNISEFSQKGKSLTYSFSKFPELYPEFFVGLIGIGESTGKLYEIAKITGLFYEQYANIKKEIRDIALYPLFILISILMLIFLLITKINPSFYNIYESMNIEPEKICLLLYRFNIKIENHPFIVIMQLVSWIILVSLIFKYAIGKISFEKISKVKIVSNFIEYFIVLIISIVISSGINISNGLEMSSNSFKSKYIVNKLKEINKSILKGSTLTQALERTNILSKYTLSVIRLREEGGSLESALRELSDNLQVDLSKKIKKYMSLINPILILIMGIIIFLVLNTLVLPLYINLQKGLI